VPRQLGRLPEARQIHERHDPLVLEMGEHATVGAPRPGATALDVDLDRLPTVVDAEHVHIRQSDKQLHHAFGVTLQSGSPSQKLESPHADRARPSSRGSDSPFRSEAPINRRVVIKGCHVLTYLNQY
jgi:hypothetical protein